MKFHKYNKLKFLTLRRRIIVEYSLANKFFVMCRWALNIIHSNFTIFCSCNQRATGTASEEKLTSPPEPSGSWARSSSRWRCWGRTWSPPSCPTSTRKSFLQKQVRWSPFTVCRVRFALTLKLLLPLTNTKTRVMSEVARDGFTKVFKILLLLKVSKFWLSCLKPYRPQTIKNDFMCEWALNNDEKATIFCQRNVWKGRLRIKAALQQQKNAVWPY